MEEEQTVLYSLDKLINVGLVEKKKCITDEKNKKKTQYVLKDYMFKFWYEFISKGTSVIEMGFIIRGRSSRFCILLWKLYLKKCADIIL